MFLLFVKRIEVLWLDGMNCAI